MARRLFQYYIRITTNKNKTMNAVKIFNHPVFGQVRIIEDDASSELLFCANDVTLALGY